MKDWMNSLTSKLIVSFLLLLLVSLCSMGIAAYLDAKMTLIELTLEQLQVSAIHKEVALNRWLETHRKATVSLALLPEVKTQAEILLTGDPSSGEFNAAYQQMQALMGISFVSQTDVREILILTANQGKIIFSTNSTLEGESRIADEYFIEGLKQTYTQTVYLSPQTNKPTLTISTPLSSNNQVLGVLAIHFNLDTPAEIITQTSPRFNQQTYWVNRFRVPIFSRNLSTKDLPRRLESSGLEAALNQQNGSHQGLNYAGQPIIGVHRWLEEWETALLVETPRYPALKPVYQLALTLLFAGLSLFIILSVIIYKLTQKITQPLLKVITAATQIAAGDLRFIPTMRTDEVGKLATALNRINRQLRRLYKSLEDSIILPQNQNKESLEISKNTPEKPTTIHQKSIPDDQLNSQQLQQFLGAIPVGIVVLDTQGNIYYSNPVAQTLFGPGAIPNAPDDLEIYPSYVGGTKQIYEDKNLPLMRALRGETVTVDDIEVHQENGIIPIEAWGTPIYDKAGNITFSIGVFKDISERKNAEAERKNFIEEMFKINCDLELALDQEEQVNMAAERFVPHQFLTFLGYDSIVDVKIGDAVQQEMSILFSDIRSFTQISEQMNPADNFKFINAYLARMEPAISNNYGVIDKFIGDAIMALFGCSADYAVQAGIEMLNRLGEYNLTRARPDRPPIKIGIGINTGDLMLGIVGGKDRMDTTVVSDAVNLAARLETLTKKYGVPFLISENTFFKLNNPDAYGLRLIDRVIVSGKSKQVSVFEVFDADPPEVRELKLLTKTKFELALTYFYEKDYSKAAQLFTDCLDQNPADLVAQMYCKIVSTKM